MRILFATSSLPDPPTSGATQRSHHLLRALQRIADVDLAVVRNRARFPADEETALWQLARLCTVVEATDGHAPPWWWHGLRRVHEKSADRLIAELNALAQFCPDPRYAVWCRDWIKSGRYDAIVGRCVPPLCRIGALDAPAATILDLDEPDPLDIETRIALQRGGRMRPSLRVKLFLRQRIVRDRVARCTHVFFLSPRARRARPSVPGSVLPNIPFDDPGEIPAPTSRVPLALFVGLLEYAPNRLGVHHFAQRIWPRVRARVPDARVRLVGQASEADAATWAALPGVEVAGRVEDLRPHYAAATACVAPVYVGAGANIRVLEAAAHARASVVTPVSHQGFEDDLRDGESVLLAGDDEEFVTHLTALLTDVPRAAALGATARTIVRERFSFEAFAAIVRDGVDAAVARRQGRTDR